jgi:hypothetical protein
VLPTGVRLVIGFDSGATAGTLTRDVAVAPQAAP